MGKKILQNIYFFAFSQLFPYHIYYTRQPFKQLLGLSDYLFEGEILQSLQLMYKSLAIEKRYTGSSFD
jgi:hypothetical protein